MKKAAIALVCTVSLSGCALPVGVTVATWAADGWSLLTTNKSLMDHGISFVAEKDCALWRVFSEDDVCMEIDGDVTVADNAGTLPAGYAAGLTTDEALADYRALTAGNRPVTTLRDVANASGQENTGPVVIASIGDTGEYVASSRAPWYKQNRNSEYLALMPKSFRESGAETPVTETPKVTKRAKAVFASAEQSDLVVPQTPSSAEAEGSAPAIDIEFSSFTGDKPPAVPVAPVEQVQPSVVADASVNDEGYAAPGRYFVIGSFQVWDNATRFAERHQAIGAQIHGAIVGGDDVYRIVVGPYRPGQQAAMMSAIAATGIEGTWNMTVKQGARVVAWGAGRNDQLASLAPQPES